MKQNRNDTAFADTYFRKFTLPKFRLGPALVSILAFIISGGAIIWGSVRSDIADTGGYTEFERGRVADRDIIAEYAVSYVDEDATRLRLEAEERMIPAVFIFSREAGDQCRSAFYRFTELSRNHFSQRSSAEAYKLTVQAEFPGAFSSDTLDTLFRDPGRDRLLDYGSAVLEYLLDTGIVAVPQIGLEMFNPDVVELYHNNGERIEREQVSYDRLIRYETVDDNINRHIAAGAFSASFAALAFPMLEPFITENVFFSSQETSLRLAETRLQTKPVMKYIEKGDQVIRKGFIVDEGDMVKLRALINSQPGYDPRPAAGHILILFLVYGFLVFMGGKRTVGRLLSPAEIYLLAILTVFYIVGAIFLRIAVVDAYFFAALVLPTALVIMLPGILIGSRLALVMAMALPLGVFISGYFDVPSFIFALSSGVTAAFVLQNAEKRIDLIKAGFILAALHVFTAAGLLLIQRGSLADYPPSVLLAAFNGIASGMLVLGFLPVLEHVLNAPTTFRLIELSDLNSPILKRLFTAAPGTYSHSVMVANMAEAACQEIGASALLARVGAYYHDIGKIDQPDYFVENQTAYNKHADIPPRLSATVIRSHVKLGVEKARLLGLPKEVSDIIAEHHGNSVISWFYHEALKRESSDLHTKSAVNMEDFTYPGNPPRSRESAVVMLADVTEAAVRTLKKPTVARLEKFIHELFLSKFDAGQLWDSDLTFRELQTIETIFVRVLAGHYHSRIEYPKQLKETAQPAAHAHSGSHGVPGLHRGR
ncbi:MAG: HDIG domain-containing protein [Treponema sp.]|jgi:putative nucleotidyltransferase with HDIG domain|nr:HDIG domain-containing protein [Treponema sp.]